MQTKGPVTKQEAAAFLKQHSDGCSLVEIAVLVGRDPSTVRIHLKRQGVRFGEHKVQWTDEMDARLAGLLRDGLSHAKAADTLNAEFGTSLTKNACIGRARRLGISGGRSGKPAVRKRTRGAKHSARTNIIQPSGTPSKPTPPPVCEDDAGRTDTITLMELQPHDCRWPVNCGGPYLFCGRRKREGSPYCPSHAARAVNRAWRAV